jgi:tRNA nucleotidyltransferase (CCA-adding enzyme)
MSPAERAILDHLKRLVSERLPLREMVLFGSHARGDAEPDSDLDVLVVLDAPADRHAREVVSDCAWEAGLEHGAVLAPLVVSRQEWEQGPERYSLLADAIRAEGVPV